MNFLFLLFTIAITQAERNIFSGDFIKDCEHTSPLPYIVDSTHWKNRWHDEVNIFKENDWKVEVSDSSATYLTTKLKTDVHGLIKGNFKKGDWSFFCY